MSTLTFANPMGAWLAPVLLGLHSSSFFEWYVYMPLMTVASLPLYYAVMRSLRANGALAMVSVHGRGFWLAGYYFLCFLLPNVVAVALKTMIVEEMDYPTSPWFASLVSPLHFYIASVVVAYLWLIVRGRRASLDYAAGLYVQVGLVGGYVVAGYRLFNEWWAWTDPTTAVSGVVMLAALLAYNWDLARRFVLARHLVGQNT